MLQYRTVEPRTLDLLRCLMSLPELKDFYLAGGTALSLYKGHRISVDLDLFSITDFQIEDILPALERKFPDMQYSNPNHPVGLFAFIRDIKVDFIRHHNFQWISEPYVEDGLRLAGIADIMAMKIAAIMKRGVKKDFWDIAELLNEYSVREFIDYYHLKYKNQQLLISIPQAMSYFADAEESEDPIGLKNQTWTNVKKAIQKGVSGYLR